MNAISLPQPYLSEDGRAVLFTITVGGREVKSSISRAALEQFFWLRSDADAECMLRTFAAGHRRITALAHRIALKSGAAEIRLDTADFAR
ncbi:DUF1488 family protein [Caballeronia sp. DA-9]|uniref:DUF1488 family protein n=1 Tax=Caballeronia sp. DA-9 TaxID=3436237 RepID=UPI003F665AA9